MVSDRCRIPWLTGSSGAKRLRIDIIIPAVYIPSILHLSTLGPSFTLISFLSMPIVMFLFYKIWKRTTSSRDNNFFFSWGVTSVAFAVYVFETAVLSFREVLLWENLLLMTMTGLAGYCLYVCRQDPGYVRRGGGKELRDKTRRPRRRDASRGHADDDESGHYIVEEDSPVHGEQQTDLEAKLAPVIPAYAVTWVDSRPFSGNYPHRLIMYTRPSSAL